MAVVLGRYRRGGDGAIWTFYSGASGFAFYDHRAAGDAGCDYRAVAAAAVCRARSCYRLALDRGADHLVGARRFHQPPPGMWQW